MKVQRVQILGKEVKDLSREGKTSNNNDFGYIFR
jgi:hypothetical protein